MNIPAEFDEIRPYSPEELPVVFDELIADPAFKSVIETVMPKVPYERFACQLRACTTNLDVQTRFCHPLLRELAANCSDGLDLDASSLPDPQTNRYTFISNHRDIILDSAFLSILLIEQHFPTTVEIAIGDNLLIMPWIKKLVRVNKAFIVQRALTMRQMLLSSSRLGRYMHFAVGQKRENIWIAQREGRAKDSNDRTQDSVLKMMAMGGEGSITERLQALHIVPTAISYEYDPCDYLKAKEFQMKRDVRGFRKSQQDDLDNMRIGLYGYKGRIHFQTGTCLDEWLGTLDPNTPKTEIFTRIATHIDSEIHRNYRLYPGNYVAADLLQGTREYTDRYTTDDADRFETYLQGQMKKIEMEHPDYDFLRERMLTMYANPVFNQRAAQSQTEETDTPHSLHTDRA